MGDTATRKSAGRSVSLDILRILAALWVVIFHWGTGTSGIAEIPEVARLGYMGVDVFFMLSGAVIIHTAIGRSWFEFARRRFLRLFPVYFAVTSVLLVWILLKGQRSFYPGLLLQPSGIELWTEQVPILGVAWTLLYEVNFYILVALFILFRGRLDERSARGGVMVFLLVLLLAIRLDEPILDFLTLGRFGPLFALGMIVGLSSSARDLRRNLPPILVAAFLSYDVLVTRVAESVDNQVSQAIWAGVILLTSGAFLVWDKLVRGKPGSRGRLTAAITTLSLMTYPAYLAHKQFGVRLVNFLVIRDVAHWIAFACAGVVLLLGCWLMVKYVEPWARSLLRRLFMWDAP